MRDLYEILGATKTASQDEIKKAYRKLARQYHPDRNPGDTDSEERFKEIQGAYDVLGDQEKRKAYDEDGFKVFADGGAGGSNFDVGDLFGGIFGRTGSAGRRQGRGQPGRDIEVEVNVSFEDSLRGLETKIPVQLDATCTTCGGSGAEAGTAPGICPECRGRGVVAESQGVFALSQPCPRCRGNGTVIERPCKTCSGSGRQRRTKRYTVKIPAGVKDGTRIQLKGKGEPGFGGGPPGDLHIVTRVAASPLYERRGADLVIEVPVTYAEAALGSEVDVPTPEGPISLKVAAGTQDGKMLRVRGRGASKLNSSGKGDLLARIKVSVPTKLNKAEREALEKLKKVSREDPRESLRV